MECGCVYRGLYYITVKSVNISEGISRGQCDGKAERGRESLWTPGQVVPYATQLLLSYLSDAP